MPLLDELLGYPSPLGEPRAPQSASNTLPSYQELRPYLALDVFEAFRPQFEAAERMTAPPRDIPRQIPTDPIPPAAHPLGSEPAALPPYETLRPYLDPKLFEAFKPQFQAFERMTARPRDAWSATPRPAAMSPAAPALSATPLPSYETLRPHLDPAVFQAFKPQFEAFERMTAPRSGVGAVTPAATSEPAAPSRGVAATGAPSPSSLAPFALPASYESLRPHIDPALFEALKPKVAQLEAMRALYGGAWIPADQVAALTSYQSPVRPASQSDSANRSLLDPAPSAPPLSGGTRLTPDLFAPTPMESARAGGYLIAPANQGESASERVATSPSREFSPGDIDPITNNTITEDTPRGEIVDEAQDADRTAPDDAESAAQKNYAQSYEHALAAIKTDSTLRRAIAGIGNGGDKDFRYRLARIIADLQLNRPAALDAIRAEVFNSQFRNRAYPGVGVNFIAAGNIKAAFDYIASLRPDLGVAEAVEAGFRPVVNMEAEQRRQINIINNTPGLSNEERKRRLREAGVSDDLFEAGLFSLLSRPYTRPLFSPADRAGGGGGGFVRPRLGRTGSRAIKTNPNEETSSPEAQTDLAGRARRPTSTTDPRTTPGVVGGTGLEIKGRWILEPMEAPVPAQVAALLKGKSFPTFDDFRSAFWKAVGGIPELAGQFSPQNRGLMRRGYAPKAPQEHQTSDQKVFILHHHVPISKGGAVYDIDNIRVVSPKRHHELHYKD
jgi:hypothetical protein